MGILKFLFGKRDVERDMFSVMLYCKNCGADNTFHVPVGTRIIRAPYLNYPREESTAIIYGPSGGAATHVSLKCKVCEVGNVA